MRVRYMFGMDFFIVRLVSALVKSISSHRT